MALVSFNDEWWWAKTEPKGILDTVDFNKITKEDVEKLCEAIKNHPLPKLNPNPLELKDLLNKK